MKLRTCVVFLCVTSVSVLTDKEWLEVETVQGRVRGRLQPHEDLYAFYNIPYATAPQGVYKFKAPLPPPIWSSTYETQTMNLICPQNKLVNQLMTEKLVMEESNCLIANVFVPTSPHENLSVLVYVHGGAFSMGYGNINKGRQLMHKKDFIMVTFNYRLGVHGFLCLGTEDIPGNAGMKDQVALLRWVQENIAHFGGNPKEVTIAGNNAGSASVDLLMLSKSAEGLFHRVIPESGGNLAAFAVQRDPLEIAKFHAKKLNFIEVHNIHALENFYKTASLHLLTSYSFFDRTDSTFLFSPCVEREREGAFLTESPLSILKKGNYKKLPVLYGFTSMEGLLRINYFDIWKHMMNKKFSDFLPADLKFQSEKERAEVADKIKRFYFGDKLVSDNNVLAFVKFFSDVIITYPMLRAMQLYVASGNSQVYLYEYSFLTNDSEQYPYIPGADHCAQSTAWLDNWDDKGESLVSGKYQKMRNVVREIWHNFIKTGTPVPQGSSLPKWPPADISRSPHMSLGEKLELRGVLLEERTLFWDDIYQRYYRDAVPPPPVLNQSKKQKLSPISTTQETLYGFRNRTLPSELETLV